MMHIYKYVCGLLGLSFFFLQARDIILEFKGSYFLPTNDRFKDIYTKGNALYGPELTVQLSECLPWYAFASFDYFQQEGHSLGLCDPTTIKLIPLGLGAKYFIPVYSDCVDVYAGLGFQPVNVRIFDATSCNNHSNQLQESSKRQSQWGFGGIVKGGAYWRVSSHFLIDFFIDYSFVSIGSNHYDSCTGVQLLKANISGVIFGAGFCYNF